MSASVGDIGRALAGRRCGKGWVCRCPAHNDHRPSLSVTERDRKILIKCWAGCDQDAVLDALRRKNLWGGKPSSDSAASRRRETSDSNAPRDPMKSWRNAAPLVRGSPADVYLKRRSRRSRVGQRCWRA
jgi:hypothetical protein